MLRSKQRDKAQCQYLAYQKTIAPATLLEVGLLNKDRLTSSIGLRLHTAQRAVATVFNPIPTLRSTSAAHQLVSALLAMFNCSLTAVDLQKHGIDQSGWQPQLVVLTIVPGAGSGNHGNPTSGPRSPAGAGPGQLPMASFSETTSTVSTAPEPS